MEEQRGKFIVLYGINNLGKSTQVEMLLAWMKDKGLDAMDRKYPLYQIEPSGPMLSDYLRKGNPFSLSPREAQMLYAFNKTQWNHALHVALENGMNVVAEDYVGTSIAWGMGAGVEKTFLEVLNGDLVQPDLAILLDGERFTEGIETGHKHESDDALMAKVRQIHLDLAQEKDWPIVNANQEKETVHAEICQLVRPVVGLK